MHVGWLRRLHPEAPIELRQKLLLQKPIGSFQVTPAIADASAADA
jgi:hypothetical protein